MERRLFLRVLHAGAVGAAAAMTTTVTRRARGAGSGSSPGPLPVQFVVARLDGAAVVEGPWLDAQLARAEALLGTQGLRVAEVGPRRELGSPWSHVESRAERDGVVAQARAGVVNVFVVASLRDVDDPAQMRKGVHWRGAGHRAILLSAIAPEGVLAHELGHYLGLGHSAQRNNVMSYDRDGGEPFFTAVQGAMMRAGAARAWASGEVGPVSR